MATYYWVGGSGTWDNTTTHWSASSGGAAGAGAPTAADDVIFDANSMPTLTTITVNGTLALCKSLTANLPAVLNLVFNLSANWTINGNVVFNGGSTTTHPVIQTNASGTTRTLTINGTASFSNVDFMDITAAGTAVPFGAVNLVPSPSFEYGTYGPNWAQGGVAATPTIDATQGFSGTHSARSVSNGVGNMGFPYMAISAATLAPVVAGAPYSAGIYMKADAAYAGTWALQFYWYDASLTQLSTTALGPGVAPSLAWQRVTLLNQIAPANAAYVRLVTFRTTAASGEAVNADAAMIVRGATLPAYVDGDTPGCFWLGIVGSSTSSYIIGDCQGNSNITFPPSRTLYWVATAGGGWSLITSWSTSSGGASGAPIPLPQDDCVFDANSITSAGRTITVNVARTGRNVTFAAVANRPAIGFGVNWNMFGDLIFGNMTISGTSTQSCRGRGAAQKFDPAGVTFTQAWAFVGPGGTYVLQNDYVTTVANTVTTALQITIGGFDANGHNITANSVVMQTTTNVKMGSGTWTITGPSTAQVAQPLAISPTANVDPGTSTIVIADTSATAKALQFGGKTLYNLVIPAGGGAIQPVANTPVTFNTVTISGPKTLTLSAGQTWTANTWLLQGSPGNPVTINSATPGTRATMAVPPSASQTIADYLVLQDSAAVGGVFYAGWNSVDNGNNTGWTFASPVAIPQPSRLLLVRERPPLRLHATITTPDGNYYRWSPDAHKAERAGSAMTFATAMPGGFDQADLVLARNPSLDYPDLQELSTVTMRGAGGRTAWQGRMETMPKTSGDQMSISPGLVGWQAHLDDDTSARQLYLDIDLSAWQGASISRQKALLQALIDEEDGTTGPDWTTNNPALLTGWSSSWTRAHASELWYDAKGLPIRIIYFTAVNVQNTNGTYTVDVVAAPSWLWRVFLSADDVLSAYDISSMSTNGTTVGFLSSSNNARPWAMLQLYYPAGGGADGINYQIYWVNMALLGVHNAPYVAGNPSGLLASDVEADALPRWAPKLKFSTGANGSIQPSSFPIPQLVFLDPTTLSAIIKEINQYELRDWAVWEGPTYYSNAFNTRGRLWQARTRDVKLEETGAQATRLFNGVMVTYTDVTGISRSVGPPGSGANTEDPSLADPDPLNPLNELGIRKWGNLGMQTAVAQSAIQVGARFLQYQKLMDTSGQATLTGHVQDMSGNWWPAYMVRAGDQISFVDAGDFSFRRIVSTSYDDNSKTNQIQLDSPPDGMQALLERFSAVMTPSGFS